MKTLFSKLFTLVLLICLFSCSKISVKEEVTRKGLIGTWVSVERAWNNPNKHAATLLIKPGGLLRYKNFNGSQWLISNHEEQVIEGRIVDLDAQSMKLLTPKPMHVKIPSYPYRRNAQWFFEFDDKIFIRKKL